jgi:hypothetical protein
VERSRYISRAKLGIERLEDRHLLSVNINWGNRNDPLNGFGTLASNSALAIQIVDRAISDWERVLLDLNYDNDNNAATNNTFNLTLSVSDLQGA